MSAVVVIPPLRPSNPFPPRSVVLARSKEKQIRGGLPAARPVHTTSPVPDAASGGPVCVFQRQTMVPSVRGGGTGHGPRGDFSKCGSLGGFSSPARCLRPAGWVH